MVDLSKYWTIRRINPTGKGEGCELWQPPVVQEFLKQQFPTLEAKGNRRVLSEQENQSIQDYLFTFFNKVESAADCTKQAQTQLRLDKAQAGLALRCYVSHAILSACKKLTSLFAAGNNFTCADLLPFVLNDDGITLVILDKDGKTQLVLDDKGEVKATKDKLKQFFSVEVLRTYDPNHQRRQSLYNWAYSQTKRNEELGKFLSEWGFRPYSDWSLLCRIRDQQKQTLSEIERHLVEVFHDVYRRDRRKRHQSRKCPEPSTEQLQEMLQLLQKQGVRYNSTQELMKAIKNLAKLLQQYDIWKHRGAPLAESMEVQDPETGNYRTIEVIDDKSTWNLDEKEHEDFEDSLHEELLKSLDEAIAQSISKKLNQLQNRTRYARFVDTVIPGLKLYYCQSKSLREIFPVLGMSSWDQARRVLDLDMLRSQVRAQTIEKLFPLFLEKVNNLELDRISNDPDYAINLRTTLESFLDATVFEEAERELTTSRNREMKSLYAQGIRRYLEDNQE